MKLKNKIILLILSIFLLSAVTNWSIQHFIIFPSFIKLERKDAQTNMIRAVSALERELKALSNLCRDWATWDDSYTFILDHNKDFVVSNLVEETYSGLKLNVLLFYDKEGRHVAGNCYDLVKEEYIHVKDIFPDKMQPDHQLLFHKDTSSSVFGILDTPYGLLLVSSQPILTSEKIGPIRGSVIMGWVLDKARTAQLNNQIVFNLEIIPLSNNTLLDQEKNIAKLLSYTKNNFIVHEHSDGILNGYSTFPDINGKPVVLLKASFPRDIIATGLLTIRNLRILSFLACFVVIAVLFISINTLITGPIMKLVDHLFTSNATGNLEPIEFSRKQDEIGSLYEEFNSLTKKLNEKSREKENIIKDLNKALAEVKTLKGILPICAYCNKIRNDQGYWDQLENYIHDHSDAEFSHGICDECYQKHLNNMD